MNFAGMRYFILEIPHTFAIIKVSRKQPLAQRAAVVPRESRIDIDPTAARIEKISAIVKLYLWNPPSHTAETCLSFQLPPSCGFRANHQPHPQFVLQAL